MSSGKMPRSLRVSALLAANRETYGVEKAAGIAAACLAAAGAVTSADAQTASNGTLPPVNVGRAGTARAPRRDAETPRSRVRPRERRSGAPHANVPPSSSRSPRPQRPAPNLPILARAPGGNPYADPRADYKVDRLQSPKFTEPVLNTPRSVTVLSKEVLEDKNATSLREVARSTAGVSLGSGEAAATLSAIVSSFVVSMRETTFSWMACATQPSACVRTSSHEQVEILRGPASSFAGRGTTGGAINIVTKQAQDVDFYRFEGQAGVNDQNKRVTVDANKSISPILAVRLNAMFQDSHIAGRDFATDNRNGIAGAVKFQPISPLLITANYSHTYISGIPDFGIPFDPMTHRPVTEGLVPRNTFYGFVNRDFTKATQNLGTLNAEYKVNDSVTVNSKFRQEYSILNYIGTIPESPTNGATAALNNANLPPTTVTLNPQSRFQTVGVLANQTDVTLKYYTGPIHNTTVFGTEVSRERVSIDSYNGLTSEGSANAFTSAGSLSGVNIFNPPNTLAFRNFNPTVTGNPQIVTVDTAAGYVIHTANYNDFIIANGGVRYDSYKIVSRNNTAAVSDDTGLIDYNAGLVIKPTPASSLYAAYATGSQPVGAELDARSGTYGALSPTATVNQIFGPQRSSSAEVGRQIRSLRPPPVDPVRLLPDQRHERAREPHRQWRREHDRGRRPAYKVKGIDFEVEGKVTDRWSVFGGLVLIDPRVTNSANPTNIGLKLANVSPRSFNLLTEVQGDRCLRDWWAGGLQVDGLRWQPARVQHAEHASCLLALRSVRRDQGRAEHRTEGLRAEHLQPHLLRLALSERSAIRARGARALGHLRGGREILSRG